MTVGEEEEEVGGDCWGGGEEVGGDCWGGGGGSRR